MDLKIASILRGRFNSPSIFPNENLFHSGDTLVDISYHYPRLVCTLTRKTSCDLTMYDLLELGLLLILWPALSDPQQARYCGTTA